MTWYDLKTSLPTGDEYAVLLFPCQTDCGLLYITSNPSYARINAIKHGYTHWAKIDHAPEHEKWIQWQRNVRSNNDNGLKL